LLSWLSTSAGACRAVRLLPYFKGGKQTRNEERVAGHGFFNSSAELARQEATGAALSCGGNLHVQQTRVEDTAFQVTRRPDDTEGKLHFRLCGKAAMKEPHLRIQVKKSSAKVTSQKKGNGRNYCH
jgi:hypothetical protein